MTSYWSWEALQRRGRWRLCLILLQKSRLFCCCTGTTSANTSFSGWYTERLGRQTNRRSHSTSLPQTSWCWCSKGRSASTDFPPISLQGGHQQPITQKSAGEESLKPQLCCTIYFYEAAWERLALIIADSRHQCSKERREGLFWCCFPCCGTLFQALRYINMSFWSKELTTRRN